MEIRLRNKVKIKIPSNAYLEIHLLSRSKTINSKYKCNKIYLSSAIPGIVMAVLIATTVSDPAKDDRYKIPVC